MSKTGPKISTLREKQLLGVRHKDRLNHNPPDYVNARIEKLDCLGDIGRKIFEYYEPMLYNNGTLSAADAVAFQMLCKKYEDWHAVLKKIEADGSYIKLTDKEGNITSIIPAPWIKLEREISAQLLKLCQEFGLTPVGRASINKIPRGDNLSKFEKLTR